MFDRPIEDAGKEAKIAEILIENSRGVFGGHNIYEGAHLPMIRMMSWLTSDAEFLMIKIDD